MKKSLTTRPDEMNDIKNTDLVQISRKLLESIIRSTGAMNIKKMSPDRLKEMKLVLSYLNATTNTVKTKLQIFKLIGIDNKIKAVKNSSKSL